MVVTFATSATIACGDAAVDPVTAPILAAKPATPVAEQLPYTWEIPEEAAIGIEITPSPRFEDNNREFVVSVHVSFRWANQVSTSVDAWLLNKNGQTVNSGKAGLSYSRFGMPVAEGDTTLTVRISTNNVTCGLIGKASYGGSAELIALDFKSMQIRLFSKTIGTTTTPDVEQPACQPIPGCEPAPATRVIGGTSGVLPLSSYCPPNWIPPMDGNQEFMTCYTVWRELWTYNFTTHTFDLIWSWMVAFYCYVVATT